MTDTAFDYTVRVSPRARYVRLYVSPHKGLEIVVPRGFNCKHLPAVLSQKSAWIERALERVRPQRERLLAPMPWRLPEHIHFPAVDAAWEVRARWTGAKRLSINFHRPGQVEIQGPVDDPALGRHLLGRFLLVQAENHLPRLLTALSHDTQLSYNRVSIRRQRSRWGSCSAHSAISLNAALLFLPHHLARYVLVHELCHTVHLNHSRNFWALVARHCPQYRAAEREMRTARDFVPRWASLD
ncbi:MAG: M48 family metallopeptidase [Burkholderiales bacterium]|nr:M48 family metallopeptidase [Burkholderiales bacterium]